MYGKYLYALINILFPKLIFLIALPINLFIFGILEKQAEKERASMVKYQNPNIVVFLFTYAKKKENYYVKCNHQYPQA
jgi:hypothetical protein